MHVAPVSLVDEAARLEGERNMRDLQSLQLVCGQRDKRKILFRKIVMEPLSKKWGHFSIIIAFSFPPKIF